MVENGEIDHTICLIGKNAGDRENDFVRKGIRLIRICLDYKHPFNYIFSIRKEMLKLKIDIMHSQLGWLGSLDTFAAWTCRTPVRIIYFHSGEWLHAGGLSRKLFSHFFIWLGRATATHFWAPSNAALTRWVPWPRIARDRLRAIPGGIHFNQLTDFSKDLQRDSNNIPRSAWVVGHVGRMTPEKNHLGILKTFSIVQTTFPDAHLVLIGDGPERKNIEKMAGQLKLQNHVTFLGTRRDVPYCLQAMDVFFFPSFFESLGLAILEAQDAGLPIVASNIPVILEALAPCWRHLIASPDDYVGLAEKIKLTRNISHDRPSEFLEAFSEQSCRNRLNEAYHQAYQQQTVLQKQDKCTSAI
jgi:glycosyltransferase involved in cell wall biosynthesis